MGKWHKGAKVICDRSGFAYYMDEMVIEPGTGYLVHKSLSDGQYNLVDHPVNNPSEYVSDWGDPYPVENARPEQDFQQDVDYSKIFKEGFGVNVTTLFGKIQSLIQITELGESVEFVFNPLGLIGSSIISFTGFTDKPINSSVASEGTVTINEIINLQTESSVTGNALIGPVKFFGTDLIVTGQITGDGTITSFNETVNLKDSGSATGIATVDSANNTVNLQSESSFNSLATFVNTSTIFSTQLTSSVSGDATIGTISVSAELLIQSSVSGTATIPSFEAFKDIIAQSNFSGLGTTNINEIVNLVTTSSLNGSANLTGDFESGAVLNNNEYTSIATITIGNIGITGQADITGTAVLTGESLTKTSLVVPNLLGEAIIPSINTLRQQIGLTEIGNRTDLIQVIVPSIAYLANDLIAFTDESSSNIQTYNYNDGKWEAVGDPLSFGFVSQTSITNLSTTRIVIADSYRGGLRVFDKNTTTNTWDQVGGTFYIGGGVDFSITTLSATRIALTDDGPNQLRVYDFDGTTWSQVGNSLNTGSFNQNVTALSSSRVALMLDSNNLYVFDFDGTNWTQTGNTFTISDGGFQSEPVIAALSSTRIAYFDDENAELRAYDFDGTNWSLTGSGLNLVTNYGTTFSPFESNYLAAISSTQVVFNRPDLDEAKVFTFNGSTWSQTGNSYSVNGEADAVCLGFSVPLGLTPSSTKEIVFHDVNLDLQEFNGTNWTDSTIEDKPVRSIDLPVIERLAPDRVAIFARENYTLSVLEYNNGTWSQVGNSEVIVSGFNDINWASLAYLSDNRIAWAAESEFGNLVLETYDFDGTNWVQVGNTFNDTDRHSLVSITYLSSTRIAMSYLGGTGSGFLETYEFDGTNWTQIGNTFSLSNIVYSSIASFQTNRIFYVDSRNDDLRVYDFDGTNWSQTGSDLNLGNVGVPALCAVSTDRIVFSDSVSEELRTYEFTLTIV